MKKLLSIILVSFFSLFLQAENLPYFCGFETVEEMSAWKFVNGTNQNKWIIGEAAAFKGSRSLYISADGGATNGFVNVPALSVAYREFDFNLPSASFYDIEISFDYRVQSYAGDTLYVVWITDEDFEIMANQTGFFPTALLINATKLPTTSAWQNFTMNQRVRNIEDGSRLTKCRLAFFWSNRSVRPTPISAAIDNVQIGRLRDGSCARPFPEGGTLIEPNAKRMSITGTHTGVKISWLNRTWFNTIETTRPDRPILASQYSLQNVPDKYDLMYKNIRGDNWTEYFGITPTLSDDTLSFEIPQLPEGVYTFWLRGKCGNDSSIWAVSPYYISTRSAGNCINFIDLHGEGVTAAWGVFNNPHQNIGVIDFGEEDARSRHTVNMIPDRFDERTGFQLRTIPENQVASVRLGNAAISMASESLTYTHIVCENSNVLLLQYAMVLNEAHLFDSAEDADFTLEILNEKGQRLNSFRFQPSDGIDIDNMVFRDGWQSYDYYPEWWRLDVIFWKDWSTIEVDLSAYEGQKIQIRLTSRACDAGGHYGYAYFTLDCTSKTTTTILYVEICENEAPRDPWDNPYLSGTYTATLQDVHGNDSIVILHLTVHNTFNVTDAITISENDLPYQYGDTIFDIGTISGEYQVFFQSIHGCDSIVNLTLKVGTSSIFTPQGEIFNIAPNPIKVGETAYVNYDFSEAEKNSLRVEIFNNVGVLLHSYQPDEYPINAGKYLNTSGIYIIRIITANNKTLIGRLIVM